MPRLLDLFCGAGGASRGYADAGFQVTGVDKKNQKAYPFRFIQADALDYLQHLIDYCQETGFEFPFDAIHASPPCQRFSNLRHAAEHKGKAHEDLIEPTRRLLKMTGVPYVIENVPGAPLQPTIVLCGSQFGLGSGERQLRRHRLFESNIPMMAPPCNHQGEAIGVYGGGPTGRYTLENGGKKDYYNRRGGYQGRMDEKREAMGIDWMNGREINQAIPPAYTEFIGQHFVRYLTDDASEEEK